MIINHTLFKRKGLSTYIMELTMMIEACHPMCVRLFYVLSFLGEEIQEL